MDAIKNISFSIALVIIGAIFILIGASGGLFIDNFSFIIDQSWAKGILLIFGVGMVGTAVFVEMKSKSTQPKLQTHDRSIDKSLYQHTGAESFFYTLDKKGIESFPEMITDAISIKIMARTIVNLLNQYEKDLEKICETGCELKFLLVNPESDVSKSLYGINPEAFYNNAIATARHLERLRGTIGTKLQTRIINRAPTISIVIVEKNEAINGMIQTQFYFLHSAVGRDRPIFNIHFGDKWFQTFADEFNELWKEGIDWKTKAFLDKNSKQGK